MTPLIKLIPQGTKFDFIGKRAMGLLLSGLLLLASLVSLGTQGLSFGIDFAGGILIEARTPQKADLPQIRSVLGGLNLGDVGVTTFGEDGRDVAIRIGIQQGGDEAQTAALNRVREALGSDLDYRRVEVVGPKVGDELVRDGALAVGLSLLAIAVYIWFRFEWQFAIGGLMALIHDVIVTLGLFSVFQLDFDLTTVAALLTIAGYSINDTVVAYDRVRENLRRYKKMELPELINRSLNEVLSRTLLTSGTTLLAVIALFVFGGEVLRGFSFALIWGIAIGTYSSIFVALPFLLYLDVRRDDEEEAGGPEKEAAPEQNP